MFVELCINNQDAIIRVDDIAFVKIVESKHPRTLKTLYILIAWVKWLGENVCTNKQEPIQLKIHASEDQKEVQEIYNEIKLALYASIQMKG